MTLGDFLILIPTCFIFFAIKSLRFTKKSLQLFRKNFKNYKSPLVFLRVALTSIIPLTLMIISAWGCIDAFLWKLEIQHISGKLNNDLHGWSLCLFSFSIFLGCFVLLTNLWLSAVFSFLDRK